MQVLVVPLESDWYVYITAEGLKIIWNEVVELFYIFIHCATCIGLKSYELIVVFTIIGS